MADEKQESSGFKVVDRRAFTTEGSPRDEASSDMKPDATRPEPKRAEAKGPDIKRFDSPPQADRVLHEEAAGSPDDDLLGEPSGFETLVSYLSTTTMFQLGLIPGPGGERIPADMPNAQRSIELLDVLQDKTRGNLTAKESRLLEDVLYELRMTFVELQKRQAHKGR